MQKLFESEGDNYRINMSLLDSIVKVVFESIRNVALAVLVTGAGFVIFTRYQSTITAVLATAFIVLGLSFYMLAAFHGMVHILRLAGLKTFGMVLMIVFYLLSGLLFVALAIKAA